MPLEAQCSPHGIKFVSSGLFGLGVRFCRGLCAAQRCPSGVVKLLAARLAARKGHDLLPSGFLLVAPTFGLQTIQLVEAHGRGQQALLEIQMSQFWNVRFGRLFGKSQHARTKPGGLRPRMSCSVQRCTSPSSPSSPMTGEGATLCRPRRRLCADPNQPGLEISCSQAHMSSPIWL